MGNYISIEPCRELQINSKAAIEAINFYEQLLTSKKRRVDYVDIQEYGEEIGLTTYCCERFRSLIEIFPDVPPAQIMSEDMNTVSMTIAKLPDCTFRSTFVQIKGIMEEIFDYVMAS